jgi:hypothetical protein
MTLVLLGGGILRSKRKLKFRQRTWTKPQDKLLSAKIYNRSARPMAVGKGSDQELRSLLARGSQNAYARKLGLIPVLKNVLLSDNPVGTIRRIKALSIVH